MLTTYRRVLGLPGALRFSTSGMLARLPISMVTLGIVLLVTSRTGSYTLAGSVSAAFVVTNALGSVPQARLLDRRGQSRVLPVCLLVFSAGLVGTMVAVELSLPALWPHLCAAAAGATMPQVGASVRARWSVLLPDKADLRVAFAFESVADEVVFIVGPALVTVLATLVHPLAGLTSAVVAALVGTTLLVAQKSTEPPVVPQGPRRDRVPLPWRVLSPLIGCAVVMGFLLGGTEVAIVAFSDEQGSTALSGLLLALWALGSLLAGVATGALPGVAPNATRFRWGMVALGVLMLPLPLVGSFPAMAAVLFLAGFAISPTLIAGFAWIEETVPPARTTEGITLFVTGIGVGIAPGAAVVGRVVDTAGASTSFVATAAAGILGAALALTTRRVSREGPAPSGSSS